MHQNPAEPCLGLPRQILDRGHRGHRIGNRQLRLCQNRHTVLTTDIKTPIQHFGLAQFGVELVPPREPPVNSELVPIPAGRTVLGLAASDPPSNLGTIQRAAAVVTGTCFEKDLRTQPGIGPGTGYRHLKFRSPELLDPVLEAGPNRVDSVIRIRVHLNPAAAGIGVLRHGKIEHEAAVKARRSHRPDSISVHCRRLS